MNPGIFRALLIAFLPNRAKIAVMRRLGATIGSDCIIGFTLLDAEKLVIGDNVRIASFNLLHRLRTLRFGDGSRINGFNWITGAGVGDFYLGRNSAVTRFHFFEASGGIRIMENSIIAGRGSHFFTHGISSTNLDDVRSITIGSWSYVGTSARFVPGSSIARGTFVGMGAVVSKTHCAEYVLLAGNPAHIKKKLSRDDIYFNRPYLPHDHHPYGYSGGQPDEA